MDNVVLPGSSKYHVDLDFGGACGLIGCWAKQLVDNIVSVSKAAAVIGFKMWFFINFY